MAGNLFEWCQNDNDDPTIVNGYGNSKSKVLRGGAFYHFWNYAACAFRSHFDPCTSDIGSGLRVVVVPLARL